MNFAKYQRPNWYFESCFQKLISFLRALKIGMNGIIFESFSSYIDNWNLYVFYILKKRKQQWISSFFFKKNSFISHACRGAAPCFLCRSTFRSTRTSASSCRGSCPRRRRRRTVPRGKSSGGWVGKWREMIENVVMNAPKESSKKSNFPSKVTVNIYSQTKVFFQQVVYANLGIFFSHKIHLEIEGIKFVAKVTVHMPISMYR